MASIEIAKPMFEALTVPLLAATAVFMPITWPAGVHERTARVARADGGVGLDQPLQRAVLGVDRAVQRGDDALGDRRAAFERERVADRDDLVADRHVGRRPERRGDESGRVVDPQEREVAARVGRDDFGAARLGSHPRPSR